MNDERTITSDEARTKMRDLLDEVDYGNNRVRITRYGKAAAVVVPVDWYDSRTDVTDLGENLPADDPSGRFSVPPVSVAQARARLLYQFDHLEGNCRIGLDVGYARQCLDEAIDDYIELVITGTIDVERDAAELVKVKAEIRDLNGQIAAAKAELAARNATPDSDDDAQP